jgi:hypothetical protein
VAGGWQVDGAIGWFGALEKVTASSKVCRAQERVHRPIRPGYLGDVIKAIAMGAQGVLGEHGSSLPLFGNE